MDQETLQVFNNDLENLFHCEFKKIDERLGRIERKYRTNYDKRDREKEREDRRIKIEEQMQSFISSFEVFWKNVFKIQEKDKEKEREESKEIIETVVKEKEIIVEEGDNKEIHEEEVEEKKKEKIEIKEIVMEKNVGKSWHTITLVPSSKLVCVVKYWDSSNIISFSNISSFYDEGNKVKEEETIEKEIEGIFVTTENVTIPIDNASFTFCVHEVMFDFLSQREVIEEKRSFTFKRKKREKRLTYFFYQNKNISKVEVITCHGFFRLIFDPGGYGARNSRTNSLEEGENDVILKSISLQDELVQ
ncbi:hypothetical protein QL285_014987 [Trifolium repens]|nr:hypothetical protein QL285_014987 [Trifolium repens]